MFWSLCYVVLRRVLQLAALRVRSNEFKELEIVVLRHELAVLRRQTTRPEHFYEWLAAIVLHHATGYLSLVSKYEFAKHRRKQEIIEELLPADLLPMLRDRAEHGRAQPPDLLMYAPDLSDWFFCEVKGPGDRLKPEQLKKFEALATMTAKPVRLLRLRWARTGSEGASSSRRCSA